MFTGIVTDMGRIASVEAIPAGLRTRILTAYDPDGIDIGASISCDGVCHTVTARGRDGSDNWFEIESAAETLRRAGVVLENVEGGVRVARGEAEDRIKGLSLGADDYLAKPFEPEELVLRINAILRRARPVTAAIRQVAFGDWHFDIGRESLSRRHKRRRTLPAPLRRLRLPRPRANCPVPGRSKP